MHIAILGATSQIAKDFICNAQNSGNYSLSLFARRPDAVRQWVKQHNLRRIQQISEIREFGCHKSYDALINFVGVGNPAIAQTMGSSILDITIEFDNLALNYLKQHTSTRYIFLSSGAAYGSAFQTPVTKLTSVS